MYFSSSVWYAFTTEDKAQLLINLSKQFGQGSVYLYQRDDDSNDDGDDDGDDDVDARVLTTDWFDGNEDISFEALRAVPLQYAYNPQCWSCFLARADRNSTYYLQVRGRVCLCVCRVFPCGFANLVPYTALFLFLGQVIGNRARFSLLVEAISSPPNDDYSSREFLFPSVSATGTLAGINV